MREAAARARDEGVPTLIEAVTYRMGPHSTADDATKYREAAELEPWQALDPFPVLKYAVLVNPLVYASEGLRGALVPSAPHIDTTVVIAALFVIDLALLYLGLKKFRSKAVS